MSEVVEPHGVPTASTPDVHIRVQDVTMAYGSFVVQQDLTFTICRGDIYVIDAEKKTVTATGDPKRLREEPTDAKLHRFLNRGDA